MPVLSPTGHVYVPLAVNTFCKYPVPFVITKLEALALEIVAVALRVKLFVPRRMFPDVKFKSDATVTALFKVKFVPIVFWIIKN